MPKFKAPPRTVSLVQPLYFFITEAASLRVVCVCVSALCHCHSDCFLRPLGIDSKSRLSFTAVLRCLEEAPDPNSGGILTSQGIPRYYL